MSLLRPLVFLTLAACTADDTRTSTQDAGLDAADGSRDTGPKDAGGDAADASDAHPGVDPCTDCILLSCPNEMSACLADSACQLAWSVYEQCRQQGGTTNCLYNFFQSGSGGDVITCGQKHCGKGACP